MGKIKKFLGHRHHSQTQRGFTLVEVLVGAILFSVIAVSGYNAFRGVLTVVSASRTNIIAMDLANERFEVIRNMPYAKVGIPGGIPNGVVNHVETFVRSGMSFVATTTIRNVDDPFDGTLGGSPNDTSPADYRLVEIEIDCVTCASFNPIFVNTHVAPKNLETSSTNGALFVRVFDANGQPVSDADVHIVNSQATSTITIDDTTNTNGMLQIVDAPPGVNAYQITVSKSGYTTDRTYTPGAVGNPNPTKPHATVVVQQVTQISFVIDRVSSLRIVSQTKFCTAIPSVDFTLSGTKLIGTPNVLKYSQNLATDGSGLKNLSNMEWDTYPVTFTDVTYDLVGMNPIFPLSIAPNSTAEVKFIVAPRDRSTLLVVVKDAAAQLPISDANVELSEGTYDETLITNRGFFRQTDWSGGGGQSTSTDATKYMAASNITTSSPAGEVKLSGASGTYDPAGELTSSTFDTGSGSNFHQLLWLPADQPVGAGPESVRMQIATNNDASTWNFLGPDGTSASYYTSANSNINSVHDGDQFIRYKMYLSSANGTSTPNISDVSFTFSSECTPPGQVAFMGVPAETYTLSVSHDDYQTYTAPVTIPNNSWQQVEVLLVPN